MTAQLESEVAASMLAVRVVGSFGVHLAGKAVPTVKVGSRKARTLLALLALHRDGLPCDRITVAVWDDTPPRSPVANIATLVSRLRATLGPNSILGGPAGYRLAEGTEVDLLKAADLVDAAKGKAPAKALVLARQAIRHLDNGDVLTEYPEARWAEAARATHLKLLRRARHVVTDAATAMGDFDVAIEAAEAAVNTDALDELAWRKLMWIHQAAGEPARALLAYESLRENLARELGADPAPATRELHVAILRGTTPPGAAG